MKPSIRVKKISLNSCSQIFNSYQIEHVKCAMNLYISLEIAINHYNFSREQR